MTDVAALAAIVAQPDLVPVLALALLAALLVLDESALAQTWLSQPLPTGILAGLVCGQPGCGLAVGLPIQLITIGNLPVGQTFTGERVSAVVAGVGAVALGGVDLPLLGAAGQGAGMGELGWVLLGVAFCSVLGNWSVQLERRVFTIWMQEGHLSLRDGRLRRFDLLLLRCLLTTALRGFGLTLLWLAMLVILWMPVYAKLPPQVTKILSWLPLLAPPLALGILIDRYGARAGWRWLTGGLVVAFVATWLLV